MKKAPKKTIKTQRRYGSSGGIDPAIVSLVVSIFTRLIQNPDLISDVVNLFRKRGATTREMETALARLLAKQAKDIDAL